MAFLKPQSPLARGDDYFYPLTTADQVIMSNGLRMEDVVGKTKTQTITLYQNGWSALAPYCYSITIKGLNDRIPARVYPVYPSDMSLDNKIAYKEELSKITHCERDGMIMTFECWEDVPTIDLVVEVEMSVLYPLESSINMDDIEPLLPKINYSVVGGLTEPSNPTENMIWVETDVPITKHKFSKNEPKNSVEGMIWFTTRNSSNISFDRLSVNDIECDEVTPLFAAQYVNGAWVSVAAKIYQNGKWVDWIVYLYAYGDECDNVTGGWITEGKKANSSASTSARAAEITRRTDSIQIGPFSTSSAGVFRCSEPVNLTEYSSIKVTGTFYSGSQSDTNLGLFVWSSIGTYYESNVVVTKYVGSQQTLKTIEIDVSKLTGDHYIGFIYNTGGYGEESYVKMSTCELI